MTLIAKLTTALSTVLIIAAGSYAQTPGKETPEVTQSEYELFSSYITHYFVGAALNERIGRPVSQIIINDMTQFDGAPIEEDMPWEKMQKFLKKKVPSLEAATLSNFQDVNTHQAILYRRFAYRLPYQLVANTAFRSIVLKAADWPKYYKQYPGAQGFLTFSRIGFSPDGKQAIFYAENLCGALCATGSYTIAERRGRRWVIVKEVIVWVS